MRDSRASLLSEYIFLFWYLCDEVIVCVLLLMIFILWDKKLRVNSYQTDVRFLHSTSLCFRACFVFGILNFNLPPFLTSLGLFSFVCFLWHSSRAFVACITSYSGYAVWVFLCYTEFWKINQICYVNCVFSLMRDVTLPKFG